MPALASGDEDHWRRLNETADCQADFGAEDAAAAALQVGARARQRAHAAMIVEKVLQRQLLGDIPGLLEPRGAL